jgi:nitrite reductase (NO-forming)
MRKIFAIGVFILAFSLVIGVTWIAPIAHSHERVAAQPATGASSAPAPAAASGTVVNVSLTAVETTQTIVPAGPGVTPVDYQVWTFDGTAPGPVIRVHLGDTVHFTLHNASTMGMQHSIDFHAAMTPWADLPAAGQTTLTGNYQPVDPGQTKSFDWVAMLPGVFMYHCGVPPVLQHISNGMYGAIIVEPENLPKEREFVLVNSEFYPGDKPVKGVYYGDLDKMLSGDPTYVVWNGVANQYKTSPLVVAPNEKFRIWVVDAGPTLTSAFHVIGAMFDSHADGNPANVVYGDQTYNIPPGGTAMFELQIPDPGLYPFLTHSFAYADLGSVGLIKVDPAAPARPDSYPLMGDPFTAGVTAFVPPDAVADVVGAGVRAGGTSASPSPMPSMSMSPSASSAGGSTGSCSPHGTVIKVTAQNVAFDASCYAAPADTPFKIVFDNMDAGTPHNVAIYTDESATTSLFTGELITGPKTITYKVPALPAGSYYFRCDVHPTQMFGTFVVK